MQNNDFERQAVPEKNKKSVISIMMVWTGYVFVVTSMIAGGGLVNILNMKDIIIIIILGNLYLSFISVGMSYIASKTGLTFALITRHSFGNQGSRIVSLFSPIINLGWYIINSAVYGSMIAQIFNLGDTGELISMALSAMIMGIIALIGFGALSTLGLVAIPAIIFLCIATAMRAMMEVGGNINYLINFTPKNPGNLSDGLMIVIGTWIFSVSTAVADIMRYAKNLKHAIISTVFSLIIGNSLLIGCGAISSAAMGQSDLPALLISMGLIIPGIILLTTNIFTTNGTNLYSNALALSNVFRNVDRRIIFYSMILFSMIITLLRPNRLDIFFNFLNFLSIIIPALPGIIFVDFYYFNKRKYPPLTETKSKNIRWSAVISWIFATLITYFLKWGFQPLNGIILAGILYFILNTIYVKLHNKESNK